MRKSRFTEAQIISILQEHAAGTATADLARRHNISRETFFKWRREYGGMGVPDAQRLKQLEDENRRLKRVVADQALNYSGPEGRTGKRVVTTKQRRSVVAHAIESAALSERGACRDLGVQRSAVRYRSRRGTDEALRDRLRELALERPRWGSPRLTWLLRREGQRINHKRVERIYREEGLAIRRRKRKRVSRAPAELPTPKAQNERWSMDFMRDTVSDGRVFRLFNVVDDCTRECLAIEVDTSLPGERVVAVLERLATTRGLPGTIVLDNGPEFSGRVLDAWSTASAPPLHSAGSACGERIHREPQRPRTRRVPEPALVPES